MLSKSKTIVVHDMFAFKGGGERLVHTLCKELKLDLAFGAKSDTSYNLDQLSGRCIDMKSESRFWGWRTVKRMCTFKYRTQFLNNYKTVIYSGQNAPLAVHQHTSGKNIYYCHTPPRSLYDLRQYQLSGLSMRRSIEHKIFNRFFQPIYESALQKMDTIVANSKNIQSRIKKYLQRDSIVIYPPCDIDKFSWIGQEGHYLSFARLDPLKRVDTIIKAFLQLPDHRLIIASSGPELPRLKKLADGKDNIIFTGAVDDNQLQKLLGNAIATVYIPKDEDFGMSPVESMAAGKPVIGVAEGGLLETIVHGETGHLVAANPTPEQLIAAIRTITPKRALAMREACENRVQYFNIEQFLRKMTALIEA